MYEFERIEKLKKDIEKNNNPKDMIELGEIYASFKNEFLAEKYFKLCADEKDNREAQRELCQLYNHQKNSALEEKYLKLIINNGDLKSFVILAEKYTEEKRYEEALELYKKIEDKNLNSICNCPFEESIIMCNLCKCYLKLNKFEEAEKYLKYVDEVDSFDCYLEVANIFYKAGMKEKAEKYYLSAFKDVKYREYENSKKKKVKISFCLGEIYLNANKLSSAEEYLKIAVENKYDAEAIQLLGTVYEKQSNLGLAKKYYSEVNTEEAKNRLNIIEQKKNLIKNL